jgi:hypothetical protein
LACGGAGLNVRVLPDPSSSDHRLSRSSSALLSFLFSLRANGCSVGVIDALDGIVGGGYRRTGPFGTAAFAPAWSRTSKAPFNVSKNAHFPSVRKKYLRTNSVLGYLLKGISVVWIVYPFNRIVYCVFNKPSIADKCTNPPQNRAF